VRLKKKFFFPDFDFFGFWLFMFAPKFSHTENFVASSVAEQGDQIGRIVAQFVSVCFGQLQKITEVAHCFWPLCLTADDQGPML
jgi:hypothetical protein